MIAAKIHNDKYVKKVDDIVNLFKWNNSLELGFPQLPSDCIILNDTIVNQPVGEDDKAYQHHATIYKKYGKIWYSHTIHEYDEDAGGMYTALNVSDDDGKTWTELTPIFPPMSDVKDRGVNPAQWSYPSLFIDLPSGFYLFMSCVSNTSYTPVGNAVRKINSDNTYGDVLWVKNNISEESRTPPTPLTGYPSYSFASDELIEEVRFFIDQPKNKPKILFGWTEIFTTLGTFSGDPLREPTTIQPYNYTDWLKVWRATSYDYNIVSNKEDTGTQIISEIPNGRVTTAKRFYNYSPEIIVMVGHSKNTLRTELMLVISRKNNSTGQYEIADGDAYSLSAITQSEPVYPGAEKWGGVQLPFIYAEGKDILHIGFSVSKETMYFKTVDVSKLLT